jgi:hypothetical protein
MLDEDLTEIYASAEAVSELGPSLSLWEFFLERVRKNLHVVAVLSPTATTGAGGKRTLNNFQKCVGGYPAFLNHCYIDIYRGWNEDALYSVAHHHLEDVAKEDTNILDSLQRACCDMQLQAETSAETYNEETAGQDVFITPSHYLAFLRTFSRMVEQWRHTISSQIMRYQVRRSGGREKEREREREKVFLPGLGCSIMARSTAFTYCTDLFPHSHLCNVHPI